MEDSKEKILLETDTSFLVRLKGFEGPLELLLHLIRKHKYQIYDIPIAEILREYLEYIEAMEELDIDLAGEFILMAATLAQIKSRMLLPKPVEEGEEPEDPRTDLVRKLLEYERFREAAKLLEERPLLGRDVFARVAEDLSDHPDRPKAPVEAELFHLLMAFREVLKEADEDFIHQVKRSRMTTQEAMHELLEKFNGLPSGESIPFRSLFPARPTKDRVVALFMGILHLVQLKAIKVVQAGDFGEIRIYPTQSEGS